MYAITSISDSRYIGGMLNRLKQLREAHGLTQEAVADALGMHHVNYNKLENGKTQLRPARIDQLARLYKIDPVEVLMEPPPGTRLVGVRGHVQAGHWAEAWQWPESDWYEVTVPADPGLRSVSLYGAETRGPSMDRRYPEGTAIVYTDMIETGEALIPGKRYIVERERADGLREATVKTLWVDDRGTYWLLPDSTDPRFQEPIPVNGQEGDTIRVVGRVRYAVQRE